MSEKNTKKALGIDIGGTKILYGIISETGEITGEIKKTPTPDTAQKIYEELKNIISRHEHEVDAIGLSTAGAVNFENTRVASSNHNLPEGYNRLDFSTLSSKKVYVENDANCAVAAEYKIGAGQGFRTVLMITIGTGIGGGLISEGRLFRGSTGNALEVGSMKIFADRRHRCVCGRYDCWESYASGTGLKNLAARAAAAYPEFETSIYNYKRPEDLSTYDITDGVEQKDAFSIRVFEQWIEYMFVGLVSLTNIFNPDCIVISGGMCKFIDAQDLERRVNEETVVTDTRVLLAKTGNNAGMIGAGVLALGEA